MSKKDAPAEPEQLTAQEQADGIELGRELLGVMVLFTLELDEQFAKLDEVGHKFAEHFSGNQALQLETHRRVAEAKFSVAIHRKLSASYCWQLFEQVQQLGFTNLEKKARLIAILTRRCLTTNLEERALQFVADVAAELEATLEVGPSLAYEERLGLCRELQALAQHKP